MSEQFWAVLSTKLEILSVDSLLSHYFTAISVNSLDFLAGGVILVKAFRNISYVSVSLVTQLRTVQVFSRILR